MKRRKKKFRLKKKFKRLLFMIFIIILFIIFIPHHKDSNKDSTSILLEKDSYLNSFENDTNSKLDDTYKDLIIKYMDLYYKSIIGLETKDISGLFYDKDGAEAYLTLNAIDLLVLHHKMQDVDMHLIKASYDIKIKEINKNNDEVTIKFLENDNITFKYLKDIDSKAYDIENTMVIKNGKIKSLRVINSYYVMFTYQMDTISKNKIDTLKKEYISKLKEEVISLKEDRGEANKNKYKTSIKCDHSYDRVKAVDYSYKYITKRNPDYFAYDTLGGNCQNLVSQSLHYSGIPYDLSGDYVWKHYDSKLDETTNKVGRSASFTGAQNFYDYIIYNKGTGICSDPNINIFYADIGDVGHVGNKVYSHAVIISKIIKDDNGNVIDMLVNCNTATLKDYPFLAYVYPKKRIIKILGYND